MGDEFTGVSGGGLTPIRPHQPYRSPSPMNGMMQARDFDDGGGSGDSGARSTSATDAGAEDNVSLQDQQTGLAMSAADLSSVLSSPRVSVLATSLVQELSVLVESYDESSVSGILPILVSMLQSLDGALRDLNQTQSVLDEIAEDNEQLHAQFERERKHRREEQQKRLEAEDAVESERREYGDELDMLRQNNRRLQKQLTTTKDQMKRSEDKLVQLRADQTELRSKYTRVNHALQLTMQREKRAFSRRTSTSTFSESPVPPSVIGEEVEMAQSLPASTLSRRTSLPVMNSPTPLEATGASYMSAIPVRHAAKGGHRNESAFTDEMASAHAVTSRTVPARKGVFHPVASSSPMRSGQEGRGVQGLALQEGDSSMLSSVKMELEQANTRITSVTEEPERASSAEPDEPETPTADRSLASEQDITPVGDEAAHVRFAPASDEHGLEDEPITAESVVARASSGYDSLTGSTELTARSHDEDDELEYERLIQAQMRGSASSGDDGQAANDQSFSQELGQFVTEEGSLLDIDPGADITVMDSENLVRQIHDLDVKKNELESVLTERDAKIQELATEQEILQQHTDSIEKQRAELHQKISALEETMREKDNKLEEAMQRKDSSSDEPLFPGADEDWRVNREKGRRFTRAEMGRVVRERNDLKEKFLAIKEELELLRKQLDEKKPSPKKGKTSLWKTIVSMFTKKSPTTRKRSETTPVPTGDGMRLESIEQGQDVATAAETPMEEAQSLTFDESRFDAYGWSLPADMRPVTSPDASHDGGASTFQAMSAQSSLSTVPVLTHSSPMVASEEQEQYLQAANKVFSAAAVCCTPQSNPSLSPSDMVCPSSLVWLCVGTTELSRVDVVDTNSPKEVLHSFPVGTSPILAAACVPGIETDIDGGGFVHIADSGTESRSLTRAEINKWRMNMSPAHSPSHLAVPGGVDGDEMSLHSAHFASRSSSERDPRSPASSSRVTSPEGEDNAPPDPDPGKESDPSADADETDRGRVTFSTKPQEKHVPSEILNRPKLQQPTMWLGAEFGALYVHSAVNSWQSCLFAMKVDASVLSITYTRQKVFLSMENGSIMVFHRDDDQVWDFDNYETIDIGKFVTMGDWEGKVPATTILAVDDAVWCGVGNSVVVLNIDTHELVKTFVVHPSNRAIVQRLVRSDDGVWVCVRRDSTLRLFNAITMEHVQDLDVSSPMQSLLTLPGSQRKPSPHNLVRISSLLISNGCLWIGANNGAIISIPCSRQRPQLPGESGPHLLVNKDDEGAVAAVEVSEGDDPLTAAAADEMDGKQPAGKEETDGTKAQAYDMKYRLPYCDIDAARLSFHGHLHHVDVLVAAPGVMASRIRSESNISRDITSSITYVLSAGSGYVDFRLHGGPVSSSNKAQAERNNIIVWQVSEPAI
eukprot:scpid11410/ scgid25451/ C-Jun-amino-terminal kinase-interacting protein 3; JNK MAP kinase scaffold protein 3; JNK/SAPK-associated protein 1; Mitogen-activated protein kinase 8-interacting protein 3; Sunday driver 2